MLYSEAARVLWSVNEGKTTVKSMALSSKYKNKKQLYALICETLKYDAILTHILEASKLLKKEKKVLKSAELSKVLLYDFLLGKGVRAASQNQQAALSKHKAALNAELVRLKVKEGAVNNNDLLPSNVKNQVCLPRHIRVNLIKTTVSDVIQHFRSEGYKLLFTEGLGYERFIDVVKGLKKKEFVCDLYLPDLMTFAPSTDLHDHVLYNSGDIILQDKASCIPACVLNAPVGSHVIDCCAAPGNKSTHAAALVGTKGKVFSFDKDIKRAATMNTMTLKAGALNVKVTHGDFLKENPNDPRYAGVTHVIVDPSCSGSGIVSRLGFLTDNEKSSSEARLQKLASFQLNILLHALSFPAIQRVVYSTCSVHEIENERVVQRALEETKEIYKLGEVLPDFPNRGHSIFVGAEKCLRLSPEEDLCNGFFVACFERTSTELFMHKQRSERDIDDGVQKQKSDNDGCSSPVNVKAKFDLLELKPDDSLDTGKPDSKKLPGGTAHGTIGDRNGKKKKKKRKQQKDANAGDSHASLADHGGCIEPIQNVPQGGSLEVADERKKKKSNQPMVTQSLATETPVIGPVKKKPKLSSDVPQSKPKNAQKNKKKMHRKRLTL